MDVTLGNVLSQGPATALALGTVSVEAAVRIPSPLLLAAKNFHDSLIPFTQVQKAVLFYQS